MGLFDFFKKNLLKNKQVDRQESESIDSNSYLIDILRNQLIELDYQVEKNLQYPALIVNSEIEIATVIIENSDYHPNIVHVMVLTIHPKYFPNGIEENIVGIGTTIQEKVNSVINNYINLTFSLIMDSLTDSHDLELDFKTIINDKEVLWHPKLGNLTFQGQWNEYPQNEPFFEIIKDKLSNKLTSNKINWLKLYISKQSDGTIIGECIFNNEPWEDGLVGITEYAKSWKINNDFLGLKQFIVFRKCDMSDD